MIETQIKIIIVGAGASGLMAAIMAAEEGAQVTILEHNDNPGKKINVTGNGRCNLSNKVMPEGAYRGENPEFVRKVFEQFSVQDTIRFFEKIGISVIDRNGYLYPRSAQAKNVTDLLVMKARSLGVKIKTKEHVTALRHDKDAWKVITETWAYSGDKVILASGSSASEVDGADGSGYALAASLGHKVVEPLPALTSLKCRMKGLNGWAGVRVNAEVSIYADGIECARDTGEVQLTDYGISGIPVFQVSRYAVRALKNGKTVKARLNFLPEMDHFQVENLLKDRKVLCPYKSEKELLIGLFPEKLCRILQNQPNPVNSITSLELDVTGHGSLKQAQVCQGGVSTAELDASTMKSKKADGLYIVGELVDIDGICGGYNLQWAWSSGAAAGRNAAKP